MIIMYTIPRNGRFTSMRWENWEFSRLIFRLHPKVKNLNCSHGKDAIHGKKAKQDYLIFSDFNKFFNKLQSSLFLLGAMNIHNISQRNLSDYASLEANCTVESSKIS